MIDAERLHGLYVAHVAELAKRTAAACAATGWDGVVLHSGTAKKKSIFDDQYWPLRLEPAFAHWAPLPVADCAVVASAGQGAGKPRLLHNVARDYWDGAPELEDERFFAAFDVVAVGDPTRAHEHFPKGARLAFVGEDLSRAEAWGFAPAACNPPELTAALDRARTVKTAYEQACVAEANRIAALGHAAVKGAFLAGDHSELDLHLLYLKHTRQDDPETPYKNIVALGEHAAVLHHVHYGRRPTGAAALLLDAGATYRGYQSDVTRTYVKGAGPGRDAFAQLLAGMEKLQQAVCAAVQPGMKYEALHDLSHRLLAPVLRDVGIVKDASDDELVDGGVTRLFLPHGLGHSLGLQTHDVGCALEKPRADNPFLRNTSVIAPGQCFTIEPGCYFIPEKLAALRSSPLGGRVDWKLVAELGAFGGIRIEDDVIVRAASTAGPPVDNLTREALS